MIIRKLGWYLRKKNTAKDGVFNKGGMTPMESVGIENMWTVLNYISAETAENEWLNSE